MATKTAEQLTRKELAERLRVHIRTVDGWIITGLSNVKLRVSRAGSRVRIAWADYLAFQAIVDRRRGHEPGPEEEVDVSNSPPSQDD